MAKIYFYRVMSGLWYSFTFSELDERNGEIGKKLEACTQKEVFGNVEEVGK
jgi:hypothetical protein